MTLCKRLFAFLASYGLSVALLLLLMALVFFGTLEQTRIGLFEAQRRYFESFLVIHPLFGFFPLPLPGGYLLLGLVFVNMVCGGILTAPKRLARPGLVIAHAGVAYLIAAGFVTYHYAVTGNLPLFEGEQGSHFQSYFDWEIRITETGTGSAGRQFVIPVDAFAHVGAGGGLQVLRADQLPFDLRVSRYLVHSRPAHGGGPWSVDGVTLEELPRQQTAENNVPGVNVTLSGDSPSMGLLWGMERAPWRVVVDGHEYAINLGRREWRLPFTLRLDKFNHETHPGTGIASHFSSEMTLIEGESMRNVVIRMNEPLRHKGYTLYQASWGSSDAREGARLYSVLAVSRDPAGKWPMYASCVISLGLLLHFTQMLLRYLRRQRAQEM